MKKKEKIYTIISILVMLGLATILVGAPIKENMTIFYAISALMGIVYFVKIVIIKRNRVIQSKLDIAVLVLVGSSIIPVLAGTYASFTDSLTTVFRYLSIFILYCMTRDLVKENANAKKYIINAILVAGVVFVVFGIDNMSTNLFQKLYDFCNNVFVYNTEQRMFSTFGYANSFAAMLGICFFLAAGQYLSTNSKWQKSILGSILFIYTAGILLSYSRGTFLIMAILAFAFFFCIKERRKKFELVEILLVSGIGACLFSFLFTRTIQMKEYSILWGSTIIISMLVCGIHYGINSLNVKMIRMKNRTIAISIIILLIIGITFVIVGFFWTKPLVLFTNNKSNKEVKYKIANIEANKEYRIVFDIEAEAGVDRIENYTIQIEEENKYYDLLQKHVISFSNVKGEKEITFIASKDTIELALIFKSEYPYAQRKLQINKMWINNKEYVLKYAYLPVELVNKIKDFRFGNKSVWERGTFLKDGILLCLEHPIAGMGGNGWRYRVGEVQSYLYGATQVHSYPIQLWLENGIGGLVGYLSITILVLVEVISYFRSKEKKELTTAILLAISLIWLHSLMDFDMSFFSISLVSFLLLAMLEPKELKTNPKREKILGIVLLVACVGMGVGVSKRILMAKQERTVEKEIEITKQEPYDNIPIKAVIIVDKAIKENTEKTISQIQYAITLIKKEFAKRTIHPEIIVRRMEMVREMIKNITHYDADRIEEITELKELLQEYYQEYEENIQNTETNRLSEIEKDFYVKRLNTIYKEMSKE